MTWHRGVGVLSLSESLTLSIVSHARRREFREFKEYRECRAKANKARKAFSPMTLLAGDSEDSSDSAFAAPPTTQPIVATLPLLPKIYM